MDAVLSWNRELGIDFVLRIFQSNNRSHADYAYKELLGEIYEDDFDKRVRPSLEIVGLRNESALLRTRAKLTLRGRVELVAEEKARAKEDAEWAAAREKEEAEWREVDKEKDAESATPSEEQP